MKTSWKERGKEDEEIRVGEWYGGFNKTGYELITQICKRNS